MNKRGLFVTPTLIGFEREQRKTKDFDWEKKKKKGKNRKQSNQWLICEWPETDSDNTVEEVRSKEGSVANSYTPAKTNMGALLKSQWTFSTIKKGKKKEKKEEALYRNGFWPQVDFLR